jgi:tagatose-1,6-bisphosphate aldolase non-catalytic subunit AgaZ/GatZ
MVSASPANLSLDDVVARLLHRYEREGWAPTLLGIGPMSSLVVRAALETGREADCPVMLIASRNQVDAAAFGGGYVEGWTQASFAAETRHLAGEIGFGGLLYTCRDHGGPWHRDEELRARLPLDEAMASAIASYRADVEAGFNLLHVDPTRDPWGAVALNAVTERSLALVEAVERARREQELAPVSYEIGTEETSGGLTADSDFTSFIVGLLARLRAEALPRPAFIVGQTGTLVKMRENIGSFDAATAQRLAAIARKHGLGFKEHNADYVATDLLAAHPQLGITAANVAPEMGVAETQALLALAEREETAVKQRSRPQAEPDVEPSGFRRIVEEKVLASGRWLKWLLPADQGTTEADLRASDARRAEVAAACGHYVFTDPEVQAARRQLYANAGALRISDEPEREILDAVKARIGRYIEAFRLEGLTTWLRSSG